LAGSNFARYEIWDGIRALDYLLTRKDVDPKRIAVAGNSGGGTQSAYLAAVEPRLAAAASSCYITSWQDLWFEPGPQDAEQVITAFLKKGLDFGDFLIAYAPRPFLILSAIRDYFPITGARSTFGEAQKLYAVLGKSEQVGFFEFDDGHGWSKPRREATYRWFDRWLKNQPGEGLEPDLETELEADLYCTETGQVATSLGGETVQTLNAKRAEDLYRRRTGTKLLDNPDAIRTLIAERLGVTLQIGQKRSTPSSSGYGEIGREGYRIEKLTLETEPGIVVPSLLFVPATEVKRKPAVLWVHPEGKAAEAKPGGDMEALVRAGYLVFAPDLRGWGESSSPEGVGGYRGVYQTTMRALLVGKTMTGMKLDDLLSSFDYVASRPDVDSGKISVFGKGNGGILALYAAALESRIRKVVCESSVVSYMDIIRSKFHEGMTDMVVPEIIRDFDVPDLAAAIAPRTIWIVNPVSPTGSRIPPNAMEGYESMLKRDEGPRCLRILDRPENWPLPKTYAEWLETD
jgi:cephalosporin-C deacetylase-like acetyl esterase